MSEAVSIASAMVGFLIFFWIIMLGVSVLMIIASWKVFEKAGEPGWAILVPFYNAYVFFKISWGNGWYFFLSAGPALAYMIAYFSLIFSAIGAGLSRYGDSFFPGYTILSNFAWAFGLMLVFWIMIFVVNIITYVKLAKAFGQGGGFACGLIFLYPVFICILAFSKNIYYVGIPGKMPPYGQPGCGNPSAPFGQAPNWQNPYYQPNGYQHPSDIAKYCPDCGSPMKKDDMFCPRCGKPQ